MMLLAMKEEKKLIVVQNVMDGKVYRRRGDQRLALGAMIQLDSSLHAWLKGQDPFGLTGGIDDATNKVWA